VPGPDGLPRDPSTENYSGLPVIVVLVSSDPRLPHRQSTTIAYHLHHEKGTFGPTRARVASIESDPCASQSVMKQTIVPRSVVIVDATVVAGPGVVPKLTRSCGRETVEPRRAYGTSKLFVVIARTGWIDRSRTEASQKQIYFTTYQSWAFLVLSQRTVVHGERASQSVVKRTTVLWSIRIDSSLTLADLGSVAIVA